MSQADLSPQEAYESYIFRTKCCPTRDNLHDFFNGLIWYTFPKTKVKLNQLQAEQIALRGAVSPRGAVRDALTIFDENAALLLAPPELLAAMVAKDWQKLFVTLRPLWKTAHVVLFGHALLEKLISPRKSHVAHVFIAESAPELIVKIQKHDVSITTAELDTWVADSMRADHMAGKPFAPLPILGIPGWCTNNENLDFYNDESVFRKPRS